MFISLASRHTDYTNMHLSAWWHVQSRHVPRELLCEALVNEGQDSQGGTWRLHCECHAHHTTMQLVLLQL